jgi:hypothetical protein
VSFKRCGRRCAAVWIFPRFLWQLLPAMKSPPSLAVPLHSHTPLPLPLALSPLSRRALGVRFGCRRLSVTSAYCVVTVALLRDGGFHSLYATCVAPGVFVVPIHCSCARCVDGVYLCSKGMYSTPTATVGEYHHTIATDTVQTIVVIAADDLVADGL